MKIEEKDGTIREMTKTEVRIYLGEAWMFCRDCGGKLYSFDGHKDAAISCPTKNECN